MPNIFKALTSIGAWMLFIGSWLMVLITLIAMGVRGDLFSSDALGLKDAIAFGLAMAGTVLAAVVVLIRKKLE
jgi:hypothetical protein